MNASGLKFSVRDNNGNTVVKGLDFDFIINIIMSKPEKFCEVCGIGLSDFRKKCLHCGIEDAVLILLGYDSNSNKVAKNADDVVAMSHRANWVYILKSTCGRYRKIGVTDGTPYKRAAEISKSSSKFGFAFEVEGAVNVGKHNMYLIEGWLHDRYHNYSMTSRFDANRIRFDGSTECFDAEEVDLNMVFKAMHNCPACDDSFKFYKS